MFTLSRGGSDWEPEGKVYYLSGGDAGIVETVKHMKRLVEESLVKPEVKRVAVMAVQACRPTDYKCYVIEVFHFIRQVMKYTPDIYNVEEITAPWVHSRRILETGSTYGDCDDFSTLQAAWLKALGVKVRFVTMASFKNKGNLDHVRIEANVLGRWLPMESTVKSAKLGQAMPSLRQNAYEV